RPPGRPRGPDDVVEHALGGLRGGREEASAVAPRRALTAAVGLVVMSLAAPAAGEPFLDVFTGVSFTPDADGHVKQPAAGNDFTVHDRSFSPGLSEGAPYYGFRVGYFLPSVPWLGFGMEFFHFKMFGETGDTRLVSGTRGGAPIDAQIPVNSV